MEDLSKALRDHQPHVVGAVADKSTLAGSIPADACDLIELRLDLLNTGEDVRQFAERHRASHPLLITARNPEEGGQNSLDAGARAAALEQFLDVGSLIDIELRSLEELAATWERAGEQGLIRVASLHNFDACPPIEELVAAIGAMKAAGADVAKLACRIVEPGDLHTLAGLLRLDPPLPLAVMGMGPLAPSSRLLAAQLGSVLNYGYLGDEPTAPGQWPASLLKEALERSQKV